MPRLDGDDPTTQNSGIQKAVWRLFGTRGTVVDRQKAHPV